MACTAGRGAWEQRMFVSLAAFGTIVLLGGFSAGACAADDVKKDSAAKDTAGKGQFFELRIYTAAEGKMDALLKRFREHTLRCFERHGIKSVGYWTAVDEKHQGRLYYIIAYPDKESRQKMLVEGIAKDPEFLKAVEESHKNGKLVDSIEEVFLQATDFSAIK
jgi:hypothetical protein